jgi:hypothetical protein
MDRERLVSSRMLEREAQLPSTKMKELLHHLCRGELRLPLQRPTTYKPLAIHRHLPELLAIGRSRLVGKSVEESRSREEPITCHP